MKFIDKKISESYFQIYILLNSKEKKELVTNVKKELLNIKKEQLEEQINLYKNISKSTNSDSSKEKLENLKQQYKNLDIKNQKFNNKEIEELLCEELMQDIFNHMQAIKIMQVFGRDLSSIGSFDDENSLTLIYSFCYLKYDYELNYPKNKGNAYFLTNKDIDMLQTELMIINKMYEKVETNEISEFSDIKFSYVHEDDIKFNLYMDISEIESKLGIDRTELIGLDKNKYVVNNNNNEKVYISINEIYDKKIYDINDDLVKKLNFENTKTVKELRKKISNIFSLVYNIKSNVHSILENLANLNEFPIDNYVYKHYSLHVEEEIKEEYSIEEINDIKIAFITSYIFAKFELKIDKYIYYIEHEYNLLFKAKNPNVSMTLEEYFNLRAPYYALYEFFKTKNLVTERSTDE